MIRRARIEDAAACALIKIKTWRYAYTGLIEQSVLDELPERQTAERWTTILETYPGANDRVGFVVEVNNTVVGYCFGILLQDQEWDLDLIAIYVLPQFHGKGYGRKLVKATLDHFPDISSMIVWVLKDNAAERFYAKLGGVHVTDRIERIGEKDYTLHGYEYDKTSIRKLLESPE